ncbi:MotA/TolQ/ExbB proton channel family protein [Aliikangiella sp. IMCC44359]|uniref:MotA/TolQ/ExbB proton channel family protein n=1 Tax=Aliikangiella sp. IMCC44359 TaxID=3459125 RepID=UPI00403ABF8C
MNLQALEHLMYELSDFFMAPVIILLILLFGYSLYASGEFIFQIWQRRRGRHQYIEATKSPLGRASHLNLKGYPLIEIAHSHPNLSKDQLDVAALEILQTVRSVSRLAPMLGLIATMIPMGPALKSLADGNIQGISENLVVAFSAVIFGLVIASITFWIANEKKKWLAKELVAITPLLVESKREVAEVPISEAA